MELPKYTFGLGDRFHKQGEALLDAMIKSNQNGLQFYPVFNKSNREHHITGTTPGDTRKAADKAIHEIGWRQPYFVDADHITLETVDSFIDSSDFFTIDVANFIGKTDDSTLNDFIRRNNHETGLMTIPGIESFEITTAFIKAVGEKFALAISEAAKVYNHIESLKTSFVAEISMDEVEAPQSPIELYFILKEIAFYKLNISTIAPRFSGRFNKGIDWRGELAQFELEFEQDLLVIKHCVDQLALDPGLKLSLHSGSDKFSIYPVIGRLCKKHDAGIHIKTAGTTWLEELRGLSLAGGDSFDLAKEICMEGLNRIEELTSPYLEVIDINTRHLPNKNWVKNCSTHEFAEAIQHDPSNPNFNADLRQLMHVSYKIAAEKGERFNMAVTTKAKIISPLVTSNIFDKHIKRLGL